MCRSDNPYGKGRLDVLYELESKLIKMLRKQQGIRHENDLKEQSRRGYVKGIISALEVIHTKISKTKKHV